MFARAYYGSFVLLQEFFFNFFVERFAGMKKSPYLCTRKTREAPARERLCGGLLKFSAPCAMPASRLES